MNNTTSKNIKKWYNFKRKLSCILLKEKGADNIIKPSRKT